MPAVTLILDDFDPFATIDPLKLQAMIDDALALAAVHAPCITSVDFAYPGAAKAILRGAILRRHEAGTGGVQSQTAGPYAMTTDTRKPNQGMFWSSELEQLRGLCQASGQSSGAFSVDTVSVCGNHQPWCSLTWDALYCSCGYDLSLAWPLWEYGPGILDGDDGYR